MSNKGMLVVVSGPSGVGKDTIIELYLEQTAKTMLSVSATTRPAREKEVHGQHYFFISHEEFENKISHDEMLEYATYNKNYYGTPKKAVEDRRNEGKHVILVIEVQGAKLIKQLVPEAVFIFIAPPSMESLEQRLVTRGTDTPEAIAQRMEAACTELSRARHYNYVLKNYELAESVEAFSCIMKAAECSPKHNPDLLEGDCFLC